MFSYGHVNFLFFFTQVVTWFEYVVVNHPYIKPIKSMIGKIVHCQTLKENRNIISLCSEEKLKGVQFSGPVKFMVLSKEVYNYDLKEKAKIFWLPKCKNRAQGSLGFARAQPGINSDLHVWGSFTCKIIHGP